MNYSFTVWIAVLLFVGACCAAYLVGHSLVFGSGTANDVFTTLGTASVGGIFLYSAAMLLLRGAPPPKKG